SRARWVTLGRGLVGARTFLHGYLLGYEDLVYATVLYRFQLPTSFSVGLRHDLRGISRMLKNETEFFLPSVAVLRFRRRLPVRPVVARARKSTGPLWWLPEAIRRLRSDAPAGLLLVLWIAAATAGVFMGGDYWTHYLILAVPPVSLWLARSVDGIVHALV